MSKIIFLNRYFYPDHSATSQMLSDLAFWLARSGTEVHVVTSRQLYDQPAAELPTEERVNGVVVHRVLASRSGRHTLPRRLLDYLTFYFTASRQLYALTRKGDTVVAKTDPPMISVFASAVAKLRGARLINWVQDLFPEVGAALGIKLLAGSSGKLLTRLRNASLRSAVRNVVLGDEMARTVEGQGVAPGRIAVIHNWSDGDTIHPLPAADNPLRQVWGLEGRFVVGYSGNLGRAHEYETILGAAERMRDDPEVVFLFIGGGAGRDRMQREVVARGLQNVQFRPYQPRDQLRLSLTLPDVHLVVLRPEVEGLIVPSKFYGVAAAGRPTLFIGAPKGEIARVVRESDAGEVVAPGDADGLVRVLRRLQQDEAARELMGRNARRVFDERFRSSLALAAWDQVLGFRSPTAVPPSGSHVRSSALQPAACGRRDGLVVSYRRHSRRSHSL
jgi:glycosyltransferase involved in cell wall biosynthesis